MICFLKILSEPKKNCILDNNKFLPNSEQGNSSPNLS